VQYLRQVDVNSLWRNFSIFRRDLVRARILNCPALSRPVSNTSDAGFQPVANHANNRQCEWVVLPLVCR